ncbi:MAG: aspartyl protease family protein [Gammaproteobacteria bacterium]|nr:aspartyl protease family protein [Gammaproteobacteria bacterium]
MKLTRNPLLACVLGVLLLDHDPGATEQDSEPTGTPIAFSGDSVTLPLIGSSVHPSVVVDLGDEQQHAFVVDTGAAVNVIDSKIADAAGFRVVGEIEVGAPGGPQIPANIVVVPLAKFGEASLTNAKFVAMEIDELSGGLMQGVLGLGPFRDYLLTFDQGNGWIQVSRQKLSKHDPGVVPFQNHDGHIQVEMTVAGTTVPVHIDTGSMAAFTLPAELMASLPLGASPATTSSARLVGGDRNIKTAQLDGDIVFANTVYKMPDVAFMDPSPGYGNIGSQILSAFVVSIDLQRQLIRFEKPVQTRPNVRRQSPRRLGAQFRGMPGGRELTIARIDAGSLAEKSGLQAGDVLTGRDTL